MVLEIRKFDIIYESYSEPKDLKDIIMFFQKHGVSINQCLKIYKKFGPDSKDIVSNNPYILIWRNIRYWILNSR